MGQKGTARGFIVVTPEALGETSRWNFDNRSGEADDYGYMQALIAHLTQILCVDARRVYIAGSSHGAAFAGLLACQQFDFAAVAMVAATAPPCPEGIAPAIITIRGTADATVSYAHSNLGSAPDLVATYAQRYHCAEGPLRDEPMQGVERLTYSGCYARAEVVLDTIIGGAHGWPGTPGMARKPRTSEASRHFPATDEILDFFDRHQG